MISMVCGIAVCSMDDEGFCVTKNYTTLGSSIVQDFIAACLNTNCSESACNSAMQNVRSMSIFSV